MITLWTIYRHCPHSTHGIASLLTRNRSFFHRTIHSSTLRIYRCDETVSSATSTRTANGDRKSSCHDSNHGLQNVEDMFTSHEPNHGIHRLRCSLSRATPDRFHPLLVTQNGKSRCNLVQRHRFPTLRDQETLHAYP